MDPAPRLCPERAAAEIIKKKDVLRSRDLMNMSKAAIDEISIVDFTSYHYATATDASGRIHDATGFNLRRDSSKCLAPSATLKKREGEQ